MTYYRLIKRITAPLTGTYQDLNIMPDTDWIKSEALALVRIMNQGPGVVANPKVSFHCIPAK